MPALNFQKQFAPKIRSGQKIHTIRAQRKRPIKQSDPLYLYTGMRTRNCIKIGDSFCKVAQDIIINQNGHVHINGEQLSVEQKEKLAHNDGFESFYAMYEWFNNNHEFPFEGQLIAWGDLKIA